MAEKADILTGKVNIFSDEWCELVFEGKNKEYGAYVNRKMSSNRHAMALITSILLVTFCIGAPSLIKFLVPHRKDKNVDVVKMIDIKMEQPKEEKFEPPPPPLKTTIKFTPPEITNEDVPDEVKTQDELIQNKAAISVADIQGTDENGVDIAELRKSVTEDKKDQIYAVVEQMPEFPGGTEEMYKFIQKNLKYPDVARESGISGRVYVQFVVDKNGHINNVRCTRGIGGGCDEEAVRVIRKMPSWRAGKQNGQAVSVYYNLPIVFTLADQ
jgi:protein TonB